MIIIVSELITLTCFFSKLDYKFLEEEWVGDIYLVTFSIDQQSVECVDGQDLPLFPIRRNLDSIVNFKRWCEKYNKACRDITDQTPYGKEGDGYHCQNAGDGNP